MFKTAVTGVLAMVLVGMFFVSEATAQCASLDWLIAPPATGNFCLGVWQKSGPSGYELNHLALSSDPSGNLVGPVQIREDITLNQRADQYEGTFTIDQYDVSGNPLAHVAGNAHYGG
jgi:hypothetical protein